MAYKSTVHQRELNNINNNNNNNNDVNSNNNNNNSNNIPGIPHSLNTSRVKVRDRQVSNSKKLKLIKQISANLDLSPPPLQIKKFNKNNDKKKKKGTFIPTPGVKESKNYQTLQRMYKKQNKSKFYTHCVLETGAGVPRSDVRYDLLQDDTIWIANKGFDLGITPEIMEETITLYECQAFRLMATHMGLPNLNVSADCSEYYPMRVATLSAMQELKIDKQAAEALYTYWIERRKLWNNALIRHFQAPPPAEDTSAHVAFRPRVTGRRVSHRNPRKNDPVAFDKMRIVRNDFKRVNDILEKEKNRDLLKRESFLYGATLFNMQLNDSIVGKRLASIVKKTNNIKGIKEQSNQNINQNINIAKLKKLFISPCPLPTLQLDEMNNNNNTDRKRKRTDSKSMDSIENFDDDSENESDQEYYNKLENYLQKSKRSTFNNRNNNIIITENLIQQYDNLPQMNPLQFSIYPNSYMYESRQNDMAQMEQDYADLYMKSKKMKLQLKLRFATDQNERAKLKRLLMNVSPPKGIAVPTLDRNSQWVVDTVLFKHVETNDSNVDRLVDDLNLDNNDPFKELVPNSSTSGYRYGLFHQRLKPSKKSTIVYNRGIKVPTAGSVTAEELLLEGTGVKPITDIGELL